MITYINPEANMLLELNTFIHGNNNRYESHIRHIELLKEYAWIICDRLNIKIDKKKLHYIAFSHDLFKERSLNPKIEVEWKQFNIPQDTVKYVRMNIDILEKFGLDDYFNSDCQFHALCAGIFLYKEFGIRDPEILYPVFFHSCPIISVYETLPARIRMMVDIIMLADKLSSNYIRINMREVDVKIDLDQVVFGTDGREFNYTMGLYLARLINQGKSNGKESEKATKYYFERLTDMNPLCKHIKLGGAKKWPKRKSQVLKTP